MATRNPNPPATVSLHRFGNHAALAIVGVKGPTVYLCPKQARDRMAELARGDDSTLCFYPSEALESAFCEGAGLDAMPGAMA